jgi:hypothetical protein
MSTPRARTPSAQLRALLRVHAEFGAGAAAAKLALLRPLARARLRTAAEVRRLHEALCFLRASPDDAALLAQVERMLASFARRADLRRHAGSLGDSGIAGTEIRYAFYWSTARWLARRWPDRLSIDWDAFEHTEALDPLLALLVPPGESLALDEADRTTQEWIDLLKGPGETDAAFVIRRIERIPGNDFTREAFFEGVEIPFLLSPGPGTPNRSTARYPRAGPAVFRTGPLDRSRPSLAEEVRRPPLGMRALSPREGRRLIDLARESMVTRERDLYQFRYADERDVRLIDCGDGLVFAAIGMLPDRRLMLDATYGFITLVNGVPVGYVLASAHYRSVEIAYNVFESFRGGESARIYGRVMAMMAWLFDADAFTIDPYQLGGEGNTEGLESGAWWFYQKLGFRPRDPGVTRTMRRELARMRAHPGHRSNRRTLEELASAPVFWHSRRPRDDIRGVIRLDRIGVRVSRYVARRFGSDREAAIRTCSDEARRLLGVHSIAGWTREERSAWERWAPLVLCLPGVERWSAADRRALAAVARAKGGRRESDFVRLFDRHRPLRRALLALTAPRAAPPRAR